MRKEINHQLDHLFFLTKEELLQLSLVELNRKREQTFLLANCLNNVIRIKKQHADKVLSI